MGDANSREYSSRNLTKLEIVDVGSMRTWGLSVSCWANSASLVTSQTDELDNFKLWF